MVRSLVPIIKMLADLSMNVFMYSLFFLLRLFTPESGGKGLLSLSLKVSRVFEGDAIAANFRDIHMC